MSPVLRFLSLGLLQALRGVTRRPRLMLACFLALIVAVVPGIARLRTVFTMPDLLAPSSAGATGINLLRQVFSEDPSAFVYVRPRSDRDFRADELCALRSFLDEAASRIEGISEIRSPFHVRRPLWSKDGRLWYPAVIATDCDPAGLKSLAGSPWSGLLTNAQGRDIGIEVLFRESDPESRFGRFPESAAREFKLKLDSFTRDRPELEIHFLGTVGHQFATLQAIEAKGALNLTVIFLLVCGFRIFQGRWRAGLVYIGTVLVACLLLFGLMGHADVPIDILSSALFLMTVVAAIEDFLFLSERQLLGARAWRSAFRELIVPSFLTSLTTVVGFGSLCVAEAPIIRKFGFWAAVAAILEWLVLFLVLPAILKQFPRLRVWTDPARAVRGRRLACATSWRPGRIWARLAALAFVAGPMAAPFLRTHDAPAELFPSSHPFSQGLARVRAERGWEIPVHVVLEGGSRDSHRRIFERFEALPLVTKLVDPYESIEYFAAGSEGPRRELVVRELSLSRAHKAQFSDTGEVKATLYLADSSLEALNGLVRDSTAFCRSPECRVVGDMIAYTEVGNEVLSVLFKSLGLSAGLVAIVLAAVAAALGRRREILALSASALWGPFVMILVMAALRVEVNFMTCVFASVLVGLAGDNALQFLFAARRRDWRHALESRGSGSLILGLVMAVTSLTFVGSTIAPERTLGLLLFFGLLANVAGDLWLFRAWLGPSLDRDASR